MTLNRIFRIGARVEFNSAGHTSRVFRGDVKAHLRGGGYAVLVDGEAKPRIVSAGRLRSTLVRMIGDGGSVA